MNHKYFDLFSEGIPGALSMLDENGLADYFDLYITEFIIQQNLAWPMAAAILNKEKTEHPRLPAVLHYCLDRCLDIAPWTWPILDLKSKLRGASESMLNRLALLRELNHEAKALEEADQLMEKYQKRSAAAILNAMLKRRPDYPLAAAMLLDIDSQDQREPGAWSKTFNCPAPLKQDWLYLLFMHYAELLDHNKALSLWKTLPESHKNPLAAITAAEMMISAGDKDGGMALYEQAVSNDPLLYPARLRLNELRSPTKPDPDATERGNVVICLYSYNKAAMLEKTLQALSVCHLGPAKIKILLNGCADDSLTRVKNCLALFPKNEVEIIELPINIGAPAARNWLMNLPDCRRSRHMAFMDDDVIPQPDFLDYFIPVMEADQKRAVVGCKTLFPGRPPTIQYLYRDISLLKNGILKMTMPNPKSKCPDSGLYSYVRDSMGVMGCLHLLRTEAMTEAGGFDIRFSPSQVDDIDHDLNVCLAGYKVTYCGLVSCVHQQDSGIGTGRTGSRMGLASLGSIIGNDLKLCYKHAEHFDKLAELSLLNRHRAQKQAEGK